MLLMVNSIAIRGQEPAKMSQFAGFVWTSDLGTGLERLPIPRPTIRCPLPPKRGAWTWDRCPPFRPRFPLLASCFPLIASAFFRFYCRFYCRFYFRFWLPFCKPYRSIVNETRRKRGTERGILVFHGEFIPKNEGR